MSNPSALQEALWALVWQGVITSDIWAPFTRPHPQRERTHLNSPQSPGSSWASCLCTTRLAAGILQHTKSGWTLVVIAGGATKRYRKDAGAGGRSARPLRHHQSSGGDSRKSLAGFHRCKRFVEVWKIPGELCEVVL
ncbi:hypothetical protein ACLB1Q_04155 [Escherichia coli]